METSTLTASLVSVFAGRFWSQLGEDRPQGLDARRERITIVSGDVGKLFDQSGVG
jgi:hypothetical protein